MTSVDLDALLRDLHVALEGRTSVDDETAVLAAQVRTDLDRVLGLTAHAGLVPRLESVIDRFEGQHPELVEAARRVLDQLANVGL